MINNKRIHLRSIYILIFLNNSFVKNNILVFFLYNQKLHKTINYSRLYNTYHNVKIVIYSIKILELVFLVITNIVFSETRLTLSAIFFTVLIALTILSNFVVRIGNKYNYFQYVKYI